MATPIAAMPQLAAKRKSSVAGLPGNTRAVKRRASKACHCCRSRKVRCDVVESGIPCTNCRLDEVECLVTEGKRRKKSYIDGDLLHQSPIESIEEKEEVQKFPLFDDIDGLQGFAASTGRAVVEDVQQPTHAEFDLNFHRPHSIYETQSHRVSPHEHSRRRSTASSYHPRFPIKPVQLPAHLQYCPPTPSRSEITLPRYITPIPRQMLSEDLEYLQKKGAFLMPETGIRNELLRSYVQYVHPYLPLLDLQDFLSIIEKNETGNTVSLLLFHAVMFAASAYVDMRYLTAQGHASRKSARKAYFQRVKLLYDFDWELDRVTVVQSVLLMTHWYESPNDPKDVWYWLGVAISIARTIGLNHNTENTTILSLRQQRLWKRIWWSMYLRDRVIAIGMRRPIRIKDEDFDVAPLQLEDFETDPLTPELCRMLGGCSAVRDALKRQTLAKMCIALADVCRRISDVLTIQYSVSGHRIGVTSETTVRLVPRTTGADSAEVIRCDRELESWYNNLPLEMRYFKPGTTRDRTDNHDGEVICVHRALLTSIYLTTISALHRPQMMPAMPSLVIAPEIKELSKRRVHEAALETTEIYRDLYAHDLIRYLPNTGVTVLLPAIIIHLLDIKSQDGADKQASMRHFHFCMQALQKLRDLYASADFSFSYLDAAIRRSDGEQDEHSNASRTQARGEQSASPSRAVSSAFRPDKNDPTLTPPPDSQDGGIKYVDQSTYSMVDGVNRSTALTPPSSDHRLSSSASDSAAISLKDLERFVGMDDMQQNGDQTFASFQAMSFDLINDTEFADQIDSHGHGMDNGMSSMNVFDQLGNFGTGPDLFAPNQVSIDDSLFKDIDMEWLADSNPEEFDQTSAACLDHQHRDSDVTSPYSAKENKDNGQLASPPISETMVSKAEQDVDMDTTHESTTPLDDAEDDEIMTPETGLEADGKQEVDVSDQMHETKSTGADDIEVETDFDVCEE